MVKLLFFIGCMVFCNNIYAQRFELSAGPAMDVNDFRWSIAGNLQGHSPNVLSELKFNAITSIGGFIKATYRPVKWLYVNTSYQKNGTVSGAVTDTDYGLDNRSGITYHEEFTSDKGFMEDLSAGLTSAVPVAKNVVLKGGAGYRQSSQKYFLLDERDARLQTTYRARWLGPTVLIGAAYTRRRFGLNLAVTGQIVSYKGKANWNLRSEFKHPVSFIQEANGYAIEPKLELTYRLNKVLSIWLNGTMGSMRTGEGIDIAYLSNDTEPVTKFNGAVRNYRAARLGMAVAF